MSLVERSASQQAIEDVTLAIEVLQTSGMLNITHIDRLIAAAQELIKQTELLRSAVLRIEQALHHSIKDAERTHAWPREREGRW